MSPDDDTLYDMKANINTTCMSLLTDFARFQEWLFTTDTDHYRHHHRYAAVYVIDTTCYRHHSMCYLRYKPVPPRYLLRYHSSVVLLVTTRLGVLVLLSYFSSLLGW
jgi:hypothetical protein